MPVTLYFDESGNTGGNLLDGAQPTHSLASVNYSQDEALTLLPPRKAEYKFSTLKRNSPGQDIVLNLIDQVASTPEKFHLTLFHKRFMVMTKLVDLLVEPMIHSAGGDLYERGANLGMANLFFVTWPVFLGRATADLILERFVAMVREPTEKTLSHFYRLLDTAIRKHGSEDYVQEIRMVRATEPFAHQYLGTWHGGDLDPAIPAFFLAASTWTSRLGTAFDIVHDEAKPILNEQLVLEAMMSPTEPTKMIGYDRRKMAFPIQATGITLGRSVDTPSLQVADILASAVTYATKSAMLKDEDPFAARILSSRLMEANVSMVWPQKQVTPQELGTEEIGGVDAPDSIGKYVADRLGGIPPVGQRRKPSQ